MQTIKVESNQIKLPPDVMKKLKGKEIRFIEFKDGYLMQPVSEAIREARGFLKNKNFSTKRFFEMKKEEKELEK